MKAQIEWKDGELWRQSTVELKNSRLNNLYFKHNGLVYVFSSMKEGTVVVTQKSKDKWVPAGRVTRNCVFLGEGLSWSETNEQRFKNEQTLPKVIMS